MIKQLIFEGLRYLQTTPQVHARDVTANLIEVGVKNLNDFEWIQQMRYYWDEELLSRVVNSEFKYGYEYLGNSGRLVITPLTDRLALTLYNLHVGNCCYLW